MGKFKLFILMGACLIIFQTRGITAKKEHTVTYETVHTSKTDLPVKPVPEQRHKHWIKGDKQRIEMFVGNDTLARTVILTKEWSFVIFPKSKRGTKSRRAPKVDDGMHSLTTAPTTLLAKVTRRGGKKVGEEKLGDVNCEVYQYMTAERTTGTVWARKSDGVVVRMKFTTPGNPFMRIVEYKDIKIGVPISDDLFQIPKDYKIQEVETKTVPIEEIREKLK